MKAYEYSNKSINLKLKMNSDLQVGNIKNKHAKDDEIKSMDSSVSPSKKQSK